MKKLILLLILPLTAVMAVDYTMTKEGLFTKQSPAPAPTTGSETSNPYLEPVNLPECDANNPEVQFIRSNADWKKINSSSKRIFCVSPGDYTSLGNIKLTASGTAAKRRYIVLNNGNDTHPGKLNKSQLANFALNLKAASYWIIDRAASFDVGITHSFRIGENSTHNIFNRLFTENNFNTMDVKNNAHNNTIQNSRFNRVSNKGLFADLSAINVLDWGKTRVEVHNLKIINNEFIDIKPYRIARSPLTSAVRDHDAPRQYVNAEGMIFDSNTVEMTTSVRTNCSGKADPNGACSWVEGGPEHKGGSQNASNPIIISNNHIWGYRPADARRPDGGPSNLSGSWGILVYMGAKYVKIRNNVIFDGTKGIIIADKYDQPYGSEDLEVTDNLLYDLGKVFNGKDATPIVFSQSLNDTIRNNTIINSYGDWANIYSNTNAYFGKNTVINPGGKNVLRANAPKGMSTNVIFEPDEEKGLTKEDSFIRAGYTSDYSFTADKFTNHPRVIVLKNAVKAN